MNDPAAPLSPDESPADTAWQPLPRRSRLLFLIGTVPGFALIGAVAGSLLGGIGDGWSAPLGGGTSGLLAGAVFGVWLGLKQYRYTFWRLDGDGLAVRRGRLWQRETRVPKTRVQHLDLKRGPLQRGRELATLIVHTAGTRHSAVTIPNLDAADAERLRDTLSVQIDHDSEA
ncbi:MAG: PH domain-containing protein [Pseudomonadota bacterium]|nr:PH domain-containing protein [Pseudomonadota bacterium]